MKTIDSKEAKEEYLRDESRKTGSAEKIYFPETEEDVIHICRENPGLPMTLQGGRTGVTAGCVPDKGIVINLERMNRILDFQPCASKVEEKNSMDGLPPGSQITVQPGILLQNLRRFLQPHKLFFPPDPTETTASLGGMAACNSSGARSFRYGATRDHVLALDIILPDGDKLHLDRGQHFATDDHFFLSTISGRTISGTLPKLSMPSVKKHTAGYYVHPNMDLVDLFIGAEGTLGIVTAMTLRLFPLKQHAWGVVVFLPAENSALKLVDLLRQAPNRIAGSGLSLCLAPEAIEFFDCDTLKLLREAQLNGSALTDMELIPSGDRSAIYVEFTSDDRNLLMRTFKELEKMIEAAGGNPAFTWAAINSHHREKLNLFRHAAPECINRKISEIKKDHPSITKLGTDMSVPDDRLEDVFDLYRRGLEKETLDSVIFGHIGNNHVHVNAIPKNPEEYSRGKALFSAWAKEIVAMGGTVSAEHGVGKLKTELLKFLYTEEQIDSMRELKARFDPKQLLNRGNIFAYKR